MNKKAILFTTMFAMILIAMAMVSAATMTRTVPASATPSQTFQVVYKTVGATGIYGVSIQDVLSEGCTFTDGTTTLKQVLLNPLTTLTFDVKAPSSGTCTFTGDYKYATENIIQFSNSAVSIGSATGCTENLIVCSSQSPSPDTIKKCVGGQWITIQTCRTNQYCDSATTTCKTTPTTQICTSGQTKCEGYNKYTCSNNAWGLSETNSAFCGYTTSGTGTEIGNTMSSIFDSIKSFFSQKVFNIGTFEVKVWMLGLAALFFIFMRK